MLLLLLLYIFLVASLDIKKKKGCERIRPCQSFYCIGSSSKSAMPVKLVLQLLRCSALQKEEGEKKTTLSATTTTNKKQKEKGHLRCVSFFILLFFLPLPTLPTALQTTYGGLQGLFLIYLRTVYVARWIQSRASKNANKLTSEAYLCTLALFQHQTHRH